MPALERGLSTIEAVAEAGAPMGFNALAEKIQVSHTTMARLLNTLVERGYLAKDEERRKYFPGPRMSATLGLQPALVDRLRMISAPVLMRLVEVTRCSAIVIYYSRVQMQCIGKATHPDGLAMQEVGTISGNLSVTPWGWLLFHSLNHESRFQAMKVMPDAERFSRDIDGILSETEKRGYAFDNGYFDPHIRRLAAPIFARSECVGALGLGNTSFRLRDDQIEEFGALLVREAKQLSEALSGY